jgi:hypothetical protein
MKSIINYVLLAIVICSGRSGVLAAPIPSSSHTGTNLDVREFGLSSRELHAYEILNARAMDSQTMETRRYDLYRRDPMERDTGDNPPPRPHSPPPGPSQRPLSRLTPIPEHSVGVDPPPAHWHYDASSHAGPSRLDHGPPGRLPRSPPDTAQHVAAPPDTAQHVAAPPAPVQPVAAPPRRGRSPPPQDNGYRPRYHPEASAKVYPAVSFIFEPYDNIFELISCFFSRLLLALEWE